MSTLLPSQSAFGVSRTAWFVIAMCVLAGTAFWCYVPGLSGGFLFDDYFNLPALGQYGPVDNIKAFLLYLTSGTADPTGRPISLLSFLIDARNWPADPAPFKCTNVLLHIVNGLLLARVLLTLGRRLPITEAKATSAAVLGAAMWTLHPFFVSTTLYIIQREAMLPATFVLIGILLWDGGMRRLASCKTGAGWRLLAGACTCTALATLSKGNGALLPLLLMAIDWALPLAGASDKPLKRARRLLLGLPALLLLAWLLTRLPAVWLGQTQGRSWTVGERLLSEGRVLCDYLWSLWIPRASAASLFNDDFVVSRGWLHPWTTLPAWLVIGALLLLAVLRRRQHPALAAGILFYFVGHLLESTIIQLELYFEHRNYLPAMLMFWPLALWLTHEGRGLPYRQALSAVLLVIVALLCHARADIWGQPIEQAELLARVKPDSARAQANAAAFEMKHGQTDLAVARLRTAARQMPKEVQLTLNWIAAECRSGIVSSDAKSATLYSLSHNVGQFDPVKRWMNRTIPEIQKGIDCKGLSLHDLDSFVDAMAQNPAFTNKRGGMAEIDHLRGRIALADGNGAAALKAFDRALANFPLPDRALTQAALLGSAGYPRLGLAHLAAFQQYKPVDRRLRGMARVHAWLLRRTGYWSSEIAHMLHVLQQDADAQSTSPPHLSEQSK